MRKVKIILKRSAIVLAITLVLITWFLYSIMWICVNGPSKRARDLFVLSVKETSAVGFLANIYLSKSQISEIIKNNSVVANDEETDTSLIKINRNKDKTVYTTEDDTKENKEDIYAEEDGIKIINISSPMYKGKLAIISDPSRVHIGTSGEYGKDKSGKTVSSIALSYGAVLATNAGGFIDEKGFGLGGEPLGMVISKGKLLYGDNNKTYEICGFTNDDIFVVGYMSPQKAVEKGIRDAVSFGPALIVNGVMSSINGTGGGMNPRTVIGQRKDGAVLLLVVDGRQAGSFGATYQDVANIMRDYGAVNAFNLDGGSSSAMYYNGRIINSVSTGGPLRDLPTSIIVE